MSEKAGVVIPISRARKAKERKFRGGGVMAEDSFKVAKAGVLDMLGGLSSAPKELAEVLAMPDTLYLVGDITSVSSDASKGIGRVFGSLMTGQPVPGELPAYGIHISERGSSVFCTLLDRRRKIIVCDSISGAYSENASWDSFIRSVRNALEEVRGRQSSGEVFDFVVNKENSMQTIRL